MTSRIATLSLGLIVAGCAAIGTDHKGPLEKPQQAADPVKATDSAFTLKQMDEFIQQASKLDITTRQAEAKRLQGKPDPVPGDRLKVAYLLSLENATLDDLAQAQVQLDKLDTAFADPETRLYVRLLQRTVAVATAQKQEKRRAEELQEKLKQIKDLELELIKRNQAKPVGGK
jgi:hypothetical protein